MTTARVDLNDDDMYTMKMVHDDKLEEGMCYIAIWAPDEYEADVLDARLGAWEVFWAEYPIGEALDILIDNSMARYGGVV